MNHQDISSFIWSVADDVLRGLFKPHEYGDVILPFVVLRRLDCVLEPKKDLVYDLYEDLSKIDGLVTRIADVVKKMSQVRRYQVQNYCGDVNILDLDAASSED